MPPPRISVGFSDHRLETLPLAEAQMRSHEVVVLEEPPSIGFAEMLTGRLSLDIYLDELELEFPAFVRASCEVLRTLAAEGLHFEQCDPYMEILLSIHDFFERGGRPHDIDEGTLIGEVYGIERRYGAALLGFYSSSGSADFGEVVASAQRFARADALRGRVRDKLRAAAIAEIFDGHRPLYVEAGTLHLPLLKELRTRVAHRACVRPVWLMEPVFRRFAQRKLLLGPGDELTLRYAFRPEFSGPRADLLAARSLIYVKLLEKEETIESTEPYAHTRSELVDYSKVARLSYADCRTLYPQVRSVASQEARRIVEHYLSLEAGD